MAVKYKKIVDLKQYNDYCNKHEKLGIKGYQKHKDEIELLEILIEEYDSRMGVFTKKLNPVELLNSILEEEEMSYAELARGLGTSRQLISDISRYRRNISKEMVTKLSHYFKMRPEAFSRPYKLKQQGKGKVAQSA